MDSPLTPYLAVADARAAVAWYAAHLGAELVGDPIEMPDGRVGHAEMRIRGARVFLSDAHPELAVLAPDPAGVPVTLHLELDDVDGLVGRLRDAGASVDREPGDTPAGRIAVVRDPFGHRWMLNQPS
ncbi:MAG TPA: VOC family protein [Pedococcus sp.]|uniref:VOC family protein n=1 Tax=Pedococcus sp. TaxID=2860345 RepID=UPI002F959EE8